MSKREQSIGGMWKLRCENRRVEKGEVKSECKSVPERLHLSTVEIPHQFARQRASKCDLKGKTISNRIEGERGERFYGNVALSPVYRHKCLHSL